MRHAGLVAAVSASLLWAGAVASPLKSAFRRRGVAQIPGYEYSGCYTEATNSRALTGTAFFDDRMTVGKCASVCADFKYFGVEYGRECYCGDKMHDGSVEAPPTDCSFACAGDSAQDCGAGNRLNLYTRTTNPQETPSLTTYQSRGCYAEPSNTGERALKSRATRADDMTVDKCAEFCGSAGYTLFGLEYYTECYCGSALMRGAEPAEAADCKYPCAGNPAQLCGGDWRLNLYEFTPEPSPDPSTTTSSAISSSSPSALPYTHSGCYTEAQGMRALSEVSYYDDAMAIEKCAAACVGYTWFGLEYGRECYGGNTLHTAEGSTQVPANECWFPCPGDPSQKCGAGDRLNLYRYLDAESPTSTSTVSFGHPTSTTVVESTSSTVEEATSTIGLSSSTTTSDATSESAAVSTTTVLTSEAVSATTAETSTVTLSADPTFDTSTTFTSVPLTTSSDWATSSSAPGSSSTSTTVADTSMTSATSSSAPAATSSSAPANAVTNGGFEETGGWTIRTNTPGALTYNFANTNDPHGGLRSASVAYSAGASAYQAWFNQVVMLEANTRYYFRGWAKASTTNPGCSISYYMATPEGNQHLKTLATVTSATLRTTWVQSAGFYDTTTLTTLTFNVRWTCTGAAARTYYVDDLSLTDTQPA